MRWRAKLRLVAPAASLPPPHGVKWMAPSRSPVVRALSPAAPPPASKSAAMERVMALCVPAASGLCQYEYESGVE